MTGIIRSAASHAWPRGLARRPLRRHLLLLVLAVVMPLMVFSTLIAWRLAQQERTAVEQRLLDEAAALALSLDRQFQTSIVALQTLANSDALDRGDLPAFYEQFARTREERGWRSGSLVAPDGTELFSLARPLGSSGALHLGDRPYFKEVMATGRPTVSNLIASRRSGEFGVVFAVPVIRHGVITGVLVPGITSERLSATLGGSHSMDAMRAIVDRDGVIVARTGTPQEFVGRRATPDFLDEIQRGTEGLYRASNVEGHRVYGAFARASVSGWTAAVAVPVAAVDAPLWRSVFLVGGTGLAFLGLSVAAAVVLARQISVPVQAATTAAQALARGEAEPVPASSVLEVAQLGDALRESGQLLRQRDEARRLADEERESARRDLEAANRSKDQFLAMLSHELRNPLAAITSATGVLDRLGSADERALRAREIVKRQAKHLQRLVDDLLDVARVTEGKVELRRRPLDLGAETEQCLKTLGGAGRLAQHRVALQRAADVWINADATRVEQIVTNLLTNAIRYTPRGGRITVSVSTERDEAVLRVADTGIGIAPELRARIFDPFTQGERGLARSEGGLGIGLTLVRQLTELHGGRVETHSEGPGHGSEFVVRFPRVAAAGADAPLEVDARAAAPRRRVLIVDGNQDTRQALRTLVEGRGHEVVLAGTGQNALDVFISAAPDVALIDVIGLPDIDGYELARRLRPLRIEGTRLIALADDGRDDDRRHTAEAGFDVHIVKPVEPERLARLLAG